MDIEEALVLAKNLIKKHRLDGWSFRFDSAKKRFGMCNYTTKEISLSKYLVSLNTYAIVKNTILHEIAHALAGPKAGHGQKWKKIMVQIGGVPSRCYGDEVQTPKLKYTAVCPCCKQSIQRKIKRDIACKKCCLQYNNGKFHKNFLFVFYQNTNSLCTKNP